MAYIVKEKFNIFDLVPEAGGGKSVIVAEPEWYLAKMYQKHLLSNGFKVRLAGEPYEIHGLLRAAPTNAVLLNIEMYEHSNAASQHIAHIMENFPGVIIVTVGFDTAGEDLKKYMSAGIGSHMNRKMSKPGDVVHIFKTLLQNNI